jgi:hypothetical protein
MKAKQITMRAVAAHLTGSLLWIFGELLDGWWRGRGNHDIKIPVDHDSLQIKLLSSSSSSQLPYKLSE